MTDTPANAGLIEQLEKIKEFFVSDYGYEQAKTLEEAAAALRAQAEAGEPVAWETRGMNWNGEWAGWMKCTENTARMFERDPEYKRGRREVRALYASPAAGLAPASEAALSSSMGVTEEMVEALKPFAEALKRVDRGGRDEAGFIGASLTLGDLRKASRTLAALSRPGGDWRPDARTVDLLDLTDDMVVAAMEHVPGSDHDDMVSAIEAALRVKAGLPPAARPAGAREQGALSDEPSDA